MPALASSIISRVRTQLIDLDGTRWSDTELLQWLSDGQRTIVAISPGACSTEATVPLVAGTRQQAPDDAHLLLTIIRNNSTAGTAPGRACRIVSREVLDASNPDWHTAASSKVAQNYMFDPAQPRTFWVYPPNNGQGAVDMIYSVMPDDITALNGELSVQPVYQTALTDYVMFRAHLKDSDFSAGQAVASMYLQAFTNFVGAGEGSQVGQGPNTQMLPSDMQTRGTAR